MTAARAAWPRANSATGCLACHTRAVPRSRLVLAGLLALVLAALAAPAVSLAGGGGSAGDQQYTDPFSGGGTSHSTSTAQATTPTPAPAPAPAPAPGSAATSATPTTPTADPTATIATATPLSTVATLPYTGYDLWTAAGFGLTMVAGGLVLRRRTRRA